MDENETKEKNTTEQSETASFLQKHRTALIAVISIAVLGILFTLSRLTNSDSEEMTLQEGDQIENILESEEPDEEELSDEKTYGGKELLDQYKEEGINIIPVEVSVLADYFSEYKNETVRTVIEYNTEYGTSSLCTEINDDILTFNFDDAEEINDINTGDVIDLIGTVEPGTSSVYLEDCHIIATGNDALVYQGELEKEADAERERIEEQIKTKTEKAEQTRYEWQQYCDEHSDKIVVATPEEIWEKYPDYEGKMVYTAFVGGTFTETDITVATSNRDSWLMWSIDCHFDDTSELDYIDTDEPIAVIGTASWVTGLNYMDLNDCHIVDVGDSVRKSLDALGGQSVGDHFNYKLFKEQELGEK